MGKKASNPGPPEGAIKPPPPPTSPARKTKSVWSNSPTPYLIDLIDADNDDVREVIIKKGCCVGMTCSIAKP